MKRHLLPLSLLYLAIAISPCWAQDMATTNKHKKPVMAIAVIHPTEGQSAHGTVFFEQVGQQVKVGADLKGLKPHTRHGFHIHEYGDCSAPDAASAGGHYNPEGYPHGAPTDAERHAGDLGNVESDAEGRAHHEITVDFITIDGDRNPILGKAVIVHSKADDLKTQPTGDAGGRIGCGVIGLANPKTIFDGHKSH
ncbi:MAG: hypothetical protein A2X46_15220 [Lentisphaerae bacterium GWF2_57_35]|nr:MAG: hypothetical protein A2X46_15220 [Lentisphaerae bacterium GWF2_57_35]